MKPKFLKFSVVYLILTGLAFVKSQNETVKLLLSSNDLTVIVNENETINLELSGNLTEKITINFYQDHQGYVEVNPNSIDIDPTKEPWNLNLSLVGLSPGHIEIVGNSTPNGIADDSSLFIRVIIANSHTIILISFIVGWIYFTAWSISFYPQMYTNFRRKSVVGLNFDFLALNFLGHSLYAMYNISLYWIPYIENEYFARYPRGVNPVELNDVGFSIHASFITALTIFQCVIYERGNQRVSYTATSILGLFVSIIIVSSILAGVGTIHWLDFLNYCSYIKLAITLIKYVPQAVMNYRRKSTSGWSIGNIILDFTGGMLSMLQMILNSYNYDDWQSIFGDPTKFGLGLFSVMFDILFIVQHYFLYRDSVYQTIPGDNIVDEEESPETEVAA